MQRRAMAGKIRCCCRTRSTGRRRSERRRGRQVRAAAAGTAAWSGARISAANSARRWCVTSTSGCASSRKGFFCARPPGKSSRLGAAREFGPAFDVSCSACTARVKMCTATGAHLLTARLHAEKVPVRAGVRRGRTSGALQESVPAVLLQMLEAQGDRALHGRKCHAEVVGLRHLRRLRAGT